MTYHPTTTVLSPLLWLRKSLLEVGPGLRPWYSAVVRRAYNDRNRIPISIVVCGLRRRETVSIAAAHGSVAKCLIINRSPWEEEEADRPRQTKRVKSARSGSSPAQVKARYVVSFELQEIYHKHFCIVRVLEFLLIPCFG